VHPTRGDHGDRFVAEPELVGDPDDVRAVLARRGGDDGLGEGIALPGQIEHDRSLSGADHEPFPRHPLEELGQIRAAHRGAQRAGERLTAVRLAVVEPSERVERTARDATRASPLAEGRAHRARRPPVAVPAGRHPAGPSDRHEADPVRRPRPERGEGVVGDDWRNR
jgi:peptidoglycan/xylan/chitin deacetylase (PgdA/CDA1 family)